MRHLTTHLLRVRAVTLSLILGFNASLSAADEIDAQIAKVTEGLRPPVSIAGDAGWSLAMRMQHYGVPGVAITVIDNGEIAWTRGFGLADREANSKVTPETLFQAGSVSKPVAAFVAMRMVQDGTLKLAQPVNERLKSWRIPENSFTRQTPVTLEHLLSHTGGLTVHGFGGYAVDAPVPTTIQVLDGAAPANSPPVLVDMLPGSSWRYSGGGYTVAQLLMTDVSGKDFPTLMRSRALKPIGMRSSTYTNPLPADWLARAAAGVLPDGTAVAGKRHTYPEMAAAGLWTTSADLALFGLQMQQAAAGRSKLLNQAHARQMLTPRLGANYGLGFGIADVDGERYFGHDGWDEGFCTRLTMHQQRGIGVVIMINANQPALMDELLRAVAFSYQWPGYHEYTRVGLSESSGETAPGRYRYNGEQVVKVSLEDGKLTMAYNGSAATELVPVGDNRFVRREREAPVSFGFDAQGKPELLFELPDGKTQRHAQLADDQLMPRELLLSGDWDSAVAAYRQLIAANDEAGSEAYLNNEGLGLADAQRFEPAIKVLKLNTELYPDSANTWDSLGQVYLQQGDRAKAREYYQKALAKDPTLPSAKAALARLGD